MYLHPCRLGNLCARFLDLEKWSGGEHSFIPGFIHSCKFVVKQPALCRHNNKHDEKNPAEKALPPQFLPAMFGVSFCLHPKGQANCLFTLPVCLNYKAPKAISRWSCLHFTSRDEFHLPRPSALLPSRRAQMEGQVGRATGWVVTPPYFYIRRK